MKNFTKNTVGRTSTTSVNSSDEVNANLAKLVQIIKMKGCPCEITPEDEYTSSTPCICFEAGINDFSFANIPNGIVTEKRAEGYIMALEDFDSIQHPSQTLSLSLLLLKWAKKLKNARSVYCEIDVPAYFSTPEEFFAHVVANEFEVNRFDYDGPFADIEEDESEYTITFELIVAPDAVKALRNSIRTCGEYHNVLATVTVQ